MVQGFRALGTDGIELGMGFCYHGLFSVAMITSATATVVAAAVIEELKGEEPSSSRVWTWICGLQAQSSILNPINPRFLVIS